MIKLDDQLTARKRGCLDGHFLVAMPGMADERFARTVIFVCAHSEDGAMGFVLNRPQGMRFPELMRKLGLDPCGSGSKASTSAGGGSETRTGTAPDFPILSGGPVDTGRGFVLHSDDYLSQSTMPVNDDLCLTATIDILRAIREGRGPNRGIMLLGYAGWASGQLENEMAANSWLSCPAHDDLVFDTDISEKYDRALALMGVSPAMLSMQSGHA